ncbi:hypothetical protein [Plastoroseomonas arctica]|uniref:Uncharacterized protein n=1 Tax=Plastoroseomonas arctica TaxID=1509237 RepID=A0AAF1JYQ4_9PROT|nr:hypothetical protein [Plastoroseomonas arctica]MBR0656155.1 hypothetical protein [Plastoroseomonas arctica]
MRLIAHSLVAAILLAVTLPAQAGIRTDNGSLQNPNAVSISEDHANQSVATGTAG